MLTAAYKGVHSVDPRDRVITSGLAPYGDPKGGDRTRPLYFWRSFFCLKDRHKLKAKHCKGFSKPKFDVFAHHAINTSGAPTKSADQSRTMRRAAICRRSCGFSGRRSVTIVPAAPSTIRSG